MGRLLSSLLTVIVGVALSSHTVVAQAPVPESPPGVPYKSSPGEVPVHLEAWVDLVCPDSKSQWKVYQQIVDHYGPDKVRFDALMFPLPYHRAAMTGAQSAFLARELDPTLAYSYFDHVFENQAALYSGEIYDQTEEYIADTYAGWAGDVGYDQAEFKARLIRSDPTLWEAVVEFKNGGTRGVYSTPQVYLNGALYYAGYDWTLDDWKAVLDPYFEEEDPGNRARRHADTVHQVEDGSREWWWA